MTEPAPSSTQPAGPPTHVVHEGDLLPRVITGHGFRRLGTVWDDGANADLRKLRVNPHTLAPGDTIVIPTHRPFEAGKATDVFHQLTLDATSLILNLTLQDFDRQPLRKRFYRLVVGERNLAGPGAVPSVPVTDVTGPKGDLSQPIPTNAAMGELTVHADDTPESSIEAKFRLLIGRLPPANTVRGLQIRLNNLGYFAGFSDKDTDQLRWAVEEFEHDHGIKPAGKFDDPRTINRIAHEHGDLLPSEKVP